MENQKFGNHPIPFNGFGGVTTQTMIRDARALKDDFLPKEVRHRDREVDQLTGALEPVVRGEDPENSFLFGPTGAGKTCIARYTLQKLQQEVLDVDIAYVNCWQDYNRFRVLYSLLEEVNQTMDVHRKSTPKDELIQRLRDYAEDPYIVILDEVDQLEDKEVLYDLYTIPNVTLVMIANREEELFVNMDDRIRSRLNSSRRTRFDSYRVNELVSILEDRVKWGLDPTAVTQEQLELIADSAAGDARVAIGVLRAAAREADHRGLEELTDEVIREAVPEAEREIEQKNVEKLNDDQAVLYEVVEEAGEVSPKDLYDRYVERVDNPVTKRTVRTYLNKMEHYNLVESEGSKRSKKYRLRE